MLDMIFIAVIIAFFAIASAYIAGCDRLRQGGDKQ
jgi:hypothetical protein